MIVGILIIIGLFLLIQLFSWISILSCSSKEVQSRSEYPKVSVLLAARNEEKLILRCLEAMAQFNYPQDQLEILIGDDASTDNTLDLVRDYIKDKPNFKVFSISEVHGKGRGKANVLGQLAHQAEGAFYFITDVDVKLPKDWILGLLQEFEDGVGIVSGTTMCESGRFFCNDAKHRLVTFYGVHQGICPCRDWMYKCWEQYGCEGRGLLANRRI